VVQAVVDEKALVVLVVLLDKVTQVVVELAQVQAVVAVVKALMVTTRQADQLQVQVVSVA
jgi:hypothetical protein